MGYEEYMAFEKTVPRWEYRFFIAEQGRVTYWDGKRVDAERIMDLKEFLTDIGRTGWELVSTVGETTSVITLYFKRPLPPLTEK